MDHGHHADAVRRGPRQGAVLAGRSPPTLEPALRASIRDIEKVQGRYGISIKPSEPGQSPALTRLGTGAATLVLCAVCLVAGTGGVPAGINVRTNRGPEGGRVQALAIEKVHIVGTGTSETCTEAALDTALASAGLVAFDCGSEPVTITITTPKTIAEDTTIDGGGLITISGGDAVGVFTVDPGVTFAIEKLTIANGFSADGGGIQNADGTVTVTNSTLTGNSALAAAGDGRGGAIFEWRGDLTIVNSTFSHNRADWGGAIFQVNRSLIVANSTFVGRTGRARSARSRDASQRRTHPRQLHPVPRCRRLA